LSKGSKPRPFSVSADTFANNFDSIFRKDAGAKDGPTIEGQALEQPEGLNHGEAEQVQAGVRRAGA
jgi:hypothetical protein